MATKLTWILDHVDGARERAERGELLAGTVDAWLLWKLTGGRVHATDLTNAHRTLLCHLQRHDWDDELLEFFRIPRAMLPEIRSCSENLGTVAPHLHPAGVPIAGMAGDQHAALFGQACFTPGMAKNTYGTGCFLLMHTGEEPVPSRHQLLTTIAWKLGDRVEYALEGSVFVAGAAIQWLRDELGLTRGSNRAHLCRAALESIGLQSADLATAMIEDSGLPLRELRVNGGASRSDPLMQFQADLLQCEVVRPPCVETTALGAAYLAGLAVGFWPDREALTCLWHASDRFLPGRPAEEMASLQKGWHRAVERARDWARDV